MSLPQKTVVANPAAADQWLLDSVRRAANDAVAQRGSFSIALSGGSSPLNFYRLLAALEPTVGQGGPSGPHSDATGFPWHKTHVWVVDERFVPIDHKDHNGAAIKAIFCNAAVGPAPLPLTQLHLIDTSTPDAVHSAAEYAIELDGHFSGQQWPVFDFILLGMGGDGHTASLFPGTGAVDIHDRTVTTCTPTTAPHERVSLTLPVLNAARIAVFLVCGESKQEMLARVLSKADKDFPASMVRPVEGSVVFLCDTAAAGV